MLKIKEVRENWILTKLITRIVITMKYERNLRMIRIPILRNRRGEIHALGDSIRFDF